MIVNSASNKQSGIGADNNKITIIDKHNKITNFELKNKREVAEDIVNYVINFTK